VYRVGVDPLHRHRWIRAAAAVGVTVAVWSMVAGLVPQPENWGEDLAVFADAGWRLAVGQTPHVDFYSPLGPVPLELLALGLRFARPSVVALFTGVALAWLVIGVVMCAVAWRRMAWWAAAWVGVWAVLLAGSPRPLGFPLDLVTSAMFYNRLAEAVVAVVAVGAFVEPRASRRTWLTSVWLAAALGVLLAVKLNYAGVAAGLIVVGGWVRRRPAWEIAATIAGGAAACAVLLAASGVPAAAFVGDMTRLLASQDAGGRLTRLGLIARLNWPSIAALCAAVAVCIRGLLGRPRQWTRDAVVAGVCAIGAVGLCATNYQERELPLVAIASVVVAVRGARSGLTGRSRIAVVAVAVVLTGGMMVEEIASVRFAAGLHARPPRAIRSIRVAAAPMADVVYVVPHWVAAINEGAGAIRTYGPSRPRVLVTDLANPFSFVLGLEPPRGDALWWHLGTTFSTAVHPPADEVFATVNVVMQPTREVDPPTVKAMWSIYGDHIRRHFEPVAETPYWTVWVRRE